MSENSALVKALAKAQGEFPEIPKDRTNEYFKSKYATLDAVISATRDPLVKNNIAVTHAFTSNENGPCVTTTLRHESGETIESSIPVNAGDKMQALGSAITYAKRYNLCALLNVTADEDDDGNAAQPQKDTKRKSPAKNAAKKAPAKSEKKPLTNEELIERATGSFKRAENHEQLMEAINKVGDSRDFFKEFEAYSQALEAAEARAGELKCSEEEINHTKRRISWYLDAHSKSPKKQLDDQAEELF